jgi:hypothetical protein
VAVVVFIALVDEGVAIAIAIMLLNLLQHGKLRRPYGTGAR